MRRFVRVLGVSAALIVCAATAARAQVQVGVEMARDRALWHFDNPSSSDTTDLVPHFFEQDYTLDNVWVNASAAYRAGVDWHTAVGLTPIRQARATDYDTFFNPGGITWVAGTTGDARMHSLRVAQSVDLGRAGSVRLSGGYRLRVDRADFLAGDRTDVRNGTLVSRTVVTTREFTSGQVHEVFLRASKEWTMSPGWVLRASGDAAPAAVHRLAIQLPDKYPGQTLVFRTTAAITSGTMEVGRTGRWPITLSASGQRSWNYSRTQWVRRSSVTVAVSLGRAW